MSYIEALHGQHPVIIGGVTKPALDHGVVRELLQHPDRLALPPGLVERCRDTRARPVRGSWGLCGACGGGGLQKEALIGAAALPRCRGAPFRPKAINNRGYILKKYSEIYTPLGGWEKATHFGKAWETGKAEGHSAGQSLRGKRHLQRAPPHPRTKLGQLPR